MAATRPVPRAALVHLSPPCSLLEDSIVSGQVDRLSLLAWARPARPCLGCIAEGGRYQHFLTFPHGWDGGVRLPEAGLVPLCAGRHAWLIAKSAGRFAPAAPAPARGRPSLVCGRAPADLPAAARDLLKKESPMRYLHPLAGSPSIAVRRRGVSILRGVICPTKIWPIFVG